MIKPLLINNIQITNNKASLTNNKAKQTNHIATLKPSKNLPNFCSTQIKRYSKGTTPFVAYQLKSLNGTLDEKILKAKDIILKDMGLPSDLVKCTDEDLGGSGYAAFSPALGQVIFDKKACQNPNAQFSDEAILCILRHELDHLEVFVKLYKKLGKDEFEKLVLNSEILVGMLPAEKRKINHEFYSQIANYVNTDNFNAEIYVNAIKNYYPALLGESHYKNFTDITKNFDNALESSAQNKQHELEQLMGVKTIENFYFMIDETKKLISELKTKGISDENELQKNFDELYSKAQKESSLEDKPENWGKIIQKARKLLA